MVFHGYQHEHVYTSFYISAISSLPVIRKEYVHVHNYFNRHLIYAFTGFFIWRLINCLTDLLIDWLIDWCLTPYRQHLSHLTTVSSNEGEGSYQILSNTPKHYGYIQNGDAYASRPGKGGGVTYRHSVTETLL